MKGEGEDGVQFGHFNGARELWVDTRLKLTRDPSGPSSTYPDGCEIMILWLKIVLEMAGGISKQHEDVYWEFIDKGCSLHFNWIVFMKILI